MIALFFELGSLLFQLGLLFIACMVLLGTAEKILPFHKGHARLGVLVIGVALAWGLVLLHNRGTRVDWEQEARLSDGGSIWIKRRTTFAHYGEPAQISRATSLLEEFEVTNPKTGQLVAWHGHYDLEPLLLDFDQGIPYLATMTKPGKHWAWGCPPHPYVFFKFADEKWERIGIKSFPAQFVKSNVYPQLNYSTRKKMQDARNNKVSFGMVEDMFTLPRPVSDEVRKIDRRIVNPMYFCQGSTILIGGDGTRHNVSLDTIYGAGTIDKLEKRYGRREFHNYISEQEAFEIGIVKIGEDK